jgi:hypothetical protein
LPLDKQKGVQRWSFIPDPKNPGYYFIKSMLNGNVIDIQGASTKAGALIDAFPQKSSGTDNQLWMPVGGSFPVSALPIGGKSISWTNIGTGWGSNNTDLSGGNKCSFTANLTIRQDGTCHFWGSYTNRGDTIGTAPAQTWGLVFLVVDSNNQGYSFPVGGNTPSAPQAGCTVSWNTTQIIEKVADNWAALITRNTAHCQLSNNYNPIDVVGGIAAAVASAIESALSTVVSDLGIAASDVWQAIATAVTESGPGDPPDSGDGSGG